MGVVYSYISYLSFPICCKIKFLINIRFTCKHLRKIWFSAHLCSQIRMHNFLEISPNIYNDSWLHDFVSVYLFLLFNNNPCHCPGHSPCQFLKSKQGKLTWTISNSNKASMNYIHDAPNSHVSAINLLELLIHVLSISRYQSR